MNVCRYSSNHPISSYKEIGFRSYGRPYIEHCSGVNIHLSTYVQIYFSLLDNLNRQQNQLLHMVKTQICICLRVSGIYIYGSYM